MVTLASKAPLQDAEDIDLDITERPPTAEELERLYDEDEALRRREAGA